MAGNRRGRPRVGGQVDLHFKHADLSPHQEQIPDKYKQLENGAAFTGRVTRCQPPRLLSHTWNEEAGGQSEVTFELTPQGEKALLVLTHRRLTSDIMLSVAGGWHTHLGILVDYLSGKVPEPFWGTHARLEQEDAQRLAAAGRAG